VPYTKGDLKNAQADLAAQADPNADHSGLLLRYPKAMVVQGQGGRVTELDALVAYLQILGRMVDFTDPAVEHALAAQGGK
jgi:cytochrome c oxidase cbb3-type subunit 2